MRTGICYAFAFMDVAARGGGFCLCAQARALDCHEISFALVHVGATGDVPAVHEYHQAGWTWDRTVRRGDVVEQILDVGTACAANLIVLTTQGHHGFSMRSVGIPQSVSCAAHGVLYWLFLPTRQRPLTPSAPSLCQGKRAAWAAIGLATRSGYHPACVPESQGRPVADMATGCSTLSTCR